MTTLLEFPREDLIKLNEKSFQVILSQSFVVLSVCNSTIAPNLGSVVEYPFSVFVQVVFMLDK